MKPFTNAEAISHLLSLKNGSILGSTIYMETYAHTYIGVHIFSGLEHINNNDVSTECKVYACIYACVCAHMCKWAKDINLRPFCYLLINS